MGSQWFSVVLPVGSRKFSMVLVLPQRFFVVFVASQWFSVVLTGSRRFSVNLVRCQCSCGFSMFLSGCRRCSMFLSASCSFS